MRALGNMETALNLTDRFSPLNLVSVARLSDGPSPAALRQALDALQARRPELRVGIGRRGREFVFQPAGPTPIPLSIVTGPSGDDWQAVVERELNTRLPASTGPLARCVYLYDPQPGAPSDVVLTLQHTIVDGDAVLGLWRELLSLAAGLPMEGAARTDLPPPSEQLYPPRFRGLRRARVIARFMAAQMSAELAYQLQLRGGRRPPLHSSARNQILARRLPAPATRALVRRCRAERVTLHSALGAAALLALQQRLYAGRPLTLRGITFGSLRAHLQPPVAEAEPGCHIAMLRYSVELAAVQPFWPLARRIQQLIDQLARRDERFAAQALAPMLIDSTNRLQKLRLAHTALSHLGAPTLAEAFGATRVLALHAFVSNHRLGPEYTLTSHLAGDELLLDIVYLDADLSQAEALAIASEMENALQAASQP